MSDPRTFKIDTPLMKGEDIANWQREIREQFSLMDIDCPIKPDGIYGTATRSFNASLCYALGMEHYVVMAKGVTPELRTRIRHRDLTPIEKERMEDRVQWRRDLRERYDAARRQPVHRPVAKIVEDSWGYHPGVHDGLDVITLPNPPIFAMVKSRIIDVRTAGWWGKAPSGDVSKGDGIIQMEVLENVGPFKRGYHIGYGHAEHPVVRVGEVVEAGEVVGRAGLAVAWHIHLMYNNGSTMKGIGNVNPRAILDYAVKNG